MEEERFKYIEFLRKNMISKRWYEMAIKRIQIFRDKVNYSIWLNMTFNKINEEMEKELMRKYENFKTKENESNQNKIWKNPWYVCRQWMDEMDV